MRIVGRAEIERSLAFPEVIAAMREAVAAQSRGECDTPMPMHLEIAGQAEVHIKSSYRHGGKYFVLKMAGPRSGMMLLCSAETGEPQVLFEDGGYLTDLRTAAVAAMMARELGRRDVALGILGTGIQARLQARLHREVLALREICIWGRTLEHAERCRQELEAPFPEINVAVAGSPAEVAKRASLIVTATASRRPLLRADDLMPGTLLSAVGADAPGKQELDPAILAKAALVLVDSRAQCLKLGELQHRPQTVVIEIGAFCDSPLEFDRHRITVCDFTGLGVEDLYIAELCAQKTT